MAQNTWRSKPSCCQFCHYILYIVMGETTKFTSHVSWTVAFCVRRTTFSCSEKDCGKKPDNMCALCRCTLYFASFGYFEATWQTYLTTIAVSLCAAIVESLPLPIDDNLTVTFIAIAVGMLLLPHWKRNLGELNPGILFDIMSVNLLCLVADLKFILVTPKFGTLPTWSLLAQPLGHWQDLIAGECPKLEKSRTRFLGANVFLLKTCTLQQDIELWIISLKRWANWSCLYTPCGENQLSNHNSIVERQNFWSSQNSRLQTFSSHYSELNWLWPFTRRGKHWIFLYCISLQNVYDFCIYSLTSVVHCSLLWAESLLHSCKDKKIHKVAGTRIIRI